MSLAPKSGSPEASTCSREWHGRTVQIKKNAVILHHPNVAEMCREKVMGRHDASVGLYKGFVEHLRIDLFYRQALKTEHAKGVRH